MLFRSNDTATTEIYTLSLHDALPILQAAFRDHHGLQCGFCTPGIVMNAIELVKQHPNPSEETVRAGLEGNFCRCTGYHNIVKAVLAGAAAMRR